MRYPPLLFAASLASLAACDPPSEALPVLRLDGRTPEACSVSVQQIGATLQRPDAGRFYRAVAQVGLSELSNDELDGLQRATRVDSLGSAALQAGMLPGCRAFAGMTANEVLAQP